MSWALHVRRLLVHGNVVATGRVVSRKWSVLLRLVYTILAVVVGRLFGRRSLETRIVGSLDRDWILSDAVGVL